MAMPRRTICEKCLNSKRVRACSSALTNGFLERVILELKVKLYHDKNHIVEIRVKQSQAGEHLEFPLEVEMAFPNSNKKIYTFKVQDRESIFQIPVDEQVNWFSFDPEFKILKTISMEAPKEMLLRAAPRRG